MASSNMALDMEESSTSQKRHPTTPLSPLPVYYYAKTALFESSKIALTTDGLVQTSTPPRNKKHRSEALELSPPPAPRKSYYREITPRSSVIFCCDEVTDFIARDQVFKRFKHALAKGIATIDYEVPFDAHTVGHLIQLTPQFERENAIRCFIWLKVSSEYREVAFEHCKKFFGRTELAEPYLCSKFRCELHNHTYQITKYEFTEIEGIGMKEAELSPQQVGREKRKTMIRKFSQGRSEEIEQFKATLLTADDEKIRAISNQVKVERKEEVSEVARRLTSPRANAEEGDLHLALASVYYSETWLD